MVRAARASLARASLTAAAFLYASATSPSRGAAPPAYDHVVIVVEENHSYSQITSTYASSAPYISTLINEGVSFTDFYAEEHHSEGNYLWMFAGSNFNIGFNDPVPVGPFNAPN